MSSAADIIHAVYEDAIFVGIRPPEFWELSYGEIRACIRAYNRREKQRAEENKRKSEYATSVAYRSVILFGKVVEAMFSKKKIPSQDETFPEWRKEETGELSIPLWKRQQAGMAGYVAAYNASLKAKNGGAQHG